MVGYLPGYGGVWYHPNGIASILSLGGVKEQYQATFNSEVKNKFLVVKPDDTIFEVAQPKGGWYCLESQAEWNEDAILW